jgi:hypothetical protein
MLTRVIKKLDNIARIDVGEIIQGVFMDRSIQDEIIRLNTLDQLFEKGENRLGIKLESVGGEYASYTVSSKQIKGQPVDRVTLFSEGEFYDSFEVIANAGDDFLTIKTNPFKDGKNILDRWGVEVIGLNQENTAWLRNEIKKRIISQVKEMVLAA